MAVDCRRSVTYFPLASEVPCANGALPRPGRPRAGSTTLRGEVAEWSNAPHSKCGIRVTVSRVRIPASPPSALDLLIFFESRGNGSHKGSTIDRSLAAGPHWKLPLEWRAPGDPAEPQSMPADGGYARQEAPIKRQRIGAHPTRLVVKPNILESWKTLPVSFARRISGRVTYRPLRNRLWHTCPGQPANPPFGK